MGITSYAQNFEDVILWRALGHIEGGAYIDIGAQDPVIDSVSLAFHERNWRGIHVEPSAQYADLLRKNRVGDVVLQAAVSGKNGLLQYFEIPDTGISTAEAEIAARHKATGFNILELWVPSITLESIFEMVGEKDVHWLKVDVEGSEKQVLSSWGQSGVRPWVVVVESTLPLTTVQNHEEWEGILLDKGYDFALFDGLNRYYVSHSHLDLVAKVSVPANVFDAFTLTSHAFSREPERDAADEVHQNIPDAPTSELGSEVRRDVSSLWNAMASVRTAINEQLQALDEAKATAALSLSNVGEFSLEIAGIQTRLSGNEARLHAQDGTNEALSKSIEQVELNLVTHKGLLEEVKLDGSSAHAAANEHAQSIAEIQDRLTDSESKYNALAEKNGSLSESVDSAGLSIRSLEASVAQTLDSLTVRGDEINLLLCSVDTIKMQLLTTDEVLKEMRLQAGQNEELVAELALGLQAVSQTIEKIESRRWLYRPRANKT
ncbi:FkbM family methyltransferase [Neorhizobium sp. DAR64872/K0K18]|uniref:FkbM family methyltransferase n=1 Tax=Neorhizobium sp. DAR64872/K0K18 TaxID=3421958 RepID=UPI003D2A8500